MTTNDITGDEIKTKANSEEYKEGLERIFGEEEIAEDDLPMLLKEQAS